MEASTPNAVTEDQPVSGSEVEEDVVHEKSGYASTFGVASWQSLNDRI